MARSPTAGWRRSRVPPSAGVAAAAAGAAAGAAGAAAAGAAAGLHAHATSVASARLAGTTTRRARDRLVSSRTSPCSRDITTLLLFLVWSGSFGAHERDPPAGLFVARRHRRPLGIPLERLEQVACEHGVADVPGVIERADLLALVLAPHRGVLLQRFEIGRAVDVDRLGRRPRRQPRPAGARRDT